jgi:hypothetical protein
MLYNHRSLSLLPRLGFDHGSMWQSRLRRYGNISWGMGGRPAPVRYARSSKRYFSLSALHSAYHLAIASLDDMVAACLPSSGFADFREGLLVTYFSAANRDVPTQKDSGLTLSMQRRSNLGAIHTQGVGLKKATRLRPARLDTYESWYRKFLA